MKTLQERFEEKYCPEPNTGCWLWTASLSGGGYGSFRVGEKKLYAHRVAYDLYKGPIPEGDGYHGTCVCHTCDTPECVNPEHLFLGTHTDNMRDRSAKGRHAGGCFGWRGEAHPGVSDVSDRQVREAMILRSMGVKLKDLAEMYNVSDSTIGDWWHKKQRTFAWAS